MSHAFNFTIRDSVFTHVIAPNIILRICRNNHAVAILEFTDETGNKINIPLGLVVYTNDYTTNKRTVLKPVGNTYALCLTDDYLIELNDKLLVSIKNTRTWDIITTNNNMKESPERTA
jgi:hypothetical protein